MFERIKKAFSKQGKDTPEGPDSQHGPVSEWAGTQGFAFSVDAPGQGIALDGKVRDKPWRMQLGRATRNYIIGQELRARADLKLDGDIAVLVMNRPLKEALEKRAYQMYTDDLQTSVDTTLPEEMRWLAMYQEAGWDGPPASFWDRFAVLADKRDDAQTWIDNELAALMVSWPKPAPSAEVPFMMLLLNGKAYLRMEYTPADLSTLRHASQIFTTACESALKAPSRR